MGPFNRFYLVTLCVALVGCGCCNVGCKYDLRKYPTPIINSQQTTHPRTHIWNPDASSKDCFDQILPPGYTNTATTPAAAAPPAGASPTVPKPMPVGPAATRTELGVPGWNEPIRTGQTTSATLPN